MTTRTLALSLYLISTIAVAGCSQASGTADTQTASPSAAGSTPGQAGKARGPSLSKETVTKLNQDYRAQCAGKQPRSEDCEILRSLIVADAVIGFQLSERAKDKRGVPQALKALDFPEEPALFVAASRVLAKFPDTPGLAEKVLPQVLANRSIRVQRASAQLLAALQDEAVADVGRLWLRNHEGLDALSDYEDYADFPKHYAQIGFPKYAGAEWFSPADSDRSIGWSTKDDMAAVTQWFTRTLHAEALDGQQWSELVVHDTTLWMDQSKSARMQALMERVAKGDQAAAAEYEKLSAEIDKARADGEELAKKSLTFMPEGSAMNEARWIVAKKKDGRVSSAVLLYPMPGVHRTVIQLGWHLADYPSAW